MCSSSQSRVRAHAVPLPKEGASRPNMCGGRWGSAGQRCIEPSPYRLGWSKRDDSTVTWPVSEVRWSERRTWIGLGLGLGSGLGKCWGSGLRFWLEAGFWLRVRVRIQGVGFRGRSTWSERRTAWRRSSLSRRKM